MAKITVANLLDRQVVRVSPLATVMHDCIVIRDTAPLSHIILGLSHLTGMKRNRTTHPALLVISAGLLLIAAAAYASHDPNASLVIGLLACAFTAGYFLSRRDSVTFVAGRYSAETTGGSLSEATRLIAAVRDAQQQ
ncbi:MAG TPA: hypothetical protein VHZ55_19725 [Bryobacteraceae bacterium]|jgi:hypothetical protein|nr:hypothetical protein [Bryobacteraceae bacterium]